MDVSLRRHEIGWDQWLRGVYYQVYEVVTQKFLSRHLKNPLPLPPLDDFTCIVTGSTSGIGLEVAKQFAFSGAQVIVAARNRGKASDLVLKWHRECRGERALRVEVMEVDLLCLRSVVRFARTWNSSARGINVFVNNAGVFGMGRPREVSGDGYEIHLQVNHLAPALLSVLLLPALLRGAPSRIVNVNSAMHYLASVDPDDMNFVKRRFSSVRGYACSKLAQVMFSGALQRRLRGAAGVSVACVTPGAVLTNVVRDLPKIVLASSRYLGPLYMLTPQEGARSALYAATDASVGEHCAALEAEGSPVCAFISAVCRPIEPCREAYDVGIGERVWEETLGMVGLPGDAVERVLKGEEVECGYEATE